MLELNREDKIIIGRDLVPNAIETYLANFNDHEFYWNKAEYRDFTNDTDLVELAEMYMNMRGEGKELKDVGKKLFKKGEKLKIPGFDRTYYNGNN